MTKPPGKQITESRTFSRSLNAVAAVHARSFLRCSMFTPEFRRGPSALDVDFPRLLLDHEHQKFHMVVQGCRGSGDDFVRFHIDNG